jgi:pimeloyl-ACP methyl ester carboxylesterase
MVFVLFGCMPPAKIPLDTIYYDTEHAQGPRLLILYLPGNGDPITVFQKKGLVEAVRQRGIPADIVAVNAHIGYYANGSVFARLKEDIIGPAKARGYDQIWLVGNSLGGYGSLSYDRVYPGDIAGVVLLGPFLGKKEVIDEMTKSGGIRQWREDIKKGDETEWEDRLWLWIKDRVQQEKFRLWAEGCERQPGCNPKIYLGYGRGDRFSYAQDFLASLMPPEHVIAIDGGHDWPTWKKLWDLFLDKNIFQANKKRLESAEVHCAP